MIDKDQRSRGRPADKARVRTRQVALTDDQELLIRVTYTRLQQICRNTEEALAVLVGMLSDFLNKTAKPELLPEAVETVIECLKLNCSADAPQPSAIIEDHEAHCSMNGPIYGSTPHCDCAFGKQFK